MNDQNQNLNSTETNLKNSNKEFILKMADEIWLKVKGIPIPDSYSEEDKLHIFERYYHRAVSKSQGE